MNTVDDTQPEHEAYELAGFGERAKARTAATLITLGFAWLWTVAVGRVLLPVLPYRFNPLHYIGTIPRLALFFWAVFLLAAAPAFRSEVVNTSRRGYATGKKTSVRVIRWEEYQNPTGTDKYPTMFDSFLRWLMPNFFLLISIVALPFGILSLILWVGVFLTSLLDKNGRGWHDYVAGTVVVKAPNTDKAIRQVVAREEAADELDRWDAKIGTAVVVFISKISDRYKKAAAR